MSIESFRPEGFPFTEEELTEARTIQDDANNKW